MKEITKEYSVEDGVFVIHHVLDALYQKYCYCIPKDIEEKVIKLISDTDFDYSKDISNQYDIVSDIIIRKVKYKKCKY